MIVKVPSYKVIKKCNEAFNFDTIDKIEDELTSELKKQYVEKNDLPKVQKWLDYYGVINYDLTIESDGVHITVNSDLFLANCQLQSIPSYIMFDFVNGNVNFSNNKLTSFRGFPRKICGNLIASYNMITDFTDCPITYLEGDLVAGNQKKVKTKYPLTKENYKLYMEGKLLENKVYVISKDEYGELLDINESQNTCSVLLQDNSILECLTSDVDCLESTYNLLKI